MRMNPGGRLGPYEILAVIGKGGMGEVYRARDSRLDRPVAIKISIEHFSERFEREARAVAALNHQHICQLYDVGPDYLVMEYIEGRPVKGPLPIEKAVEYAGQILEALDAAHQKGIIHRDLKPANILVAKQGIKLLDFGLAKWTPPINEDAVTLTSSLTEQGEIVGTLNYMAPEQLQGKGADARSDLFAFGCVLYEMLTGKPPFAGESMASVIAAILEREPAPLTKLPDLDRVVRRSMAKDPDQRFQTARDLKTAILWAVEHQPSSAKSKPTRRWWTAAAVAASFALGSGVVVYLDKSLADNDVYRLQINPPIGGRFVFGGNPGGFAISPNGRTVAFVGSVDGKTQLWVRSLEGKESRPIAGTERAASPFWSPDNKSVGFFMDGKLKRFDLAGGAPFTICDAAIPRGGAWSSNGEILVGTGAFGLFRVPASGGTPVPLTALNAVRGEVLHRWPQVLPSGKFLYWVGSDSPVNNGIYAASIANPGESVQLVATESNALYAPGNGSRGYLLWVRGEALLAQELDPRSLKLGGEPHLIVERISKTGIARTNFAVSANGLLLYSDDDTSGQLSWIDRTGKRLPLTVEHSDYTSFRLSPDRRRVIASRHPGTLALLELERGVVSHIASSSPVNLNPVWSPDGRTIVFSSGIRRDLFRKELNGSGNEELIWQSAQPKLPTDWSRDGRFILYHEYAPVSRDLWVLGVTPDGKPAPNAKPVPYLQTPFNETQGRFSPEAPPRWVAYQSDETGRNEVYVQSFPNARGKFQISIGGGQLPEWGAGGREIYYLSPNRKLMVVNVKLGADSIEPSVPREMFPLLPASDEDSLFYEAAPDGQRFLVSLISEHSTAPLTIVMNWPALLKNGSAAH